MSGNGMVRAAWFAGSVAAAAAAAPPGVLPTPLAALALTAALALVPGAWLSGRLAPAGAGSRTALALLLAPAAGGSTLTLARMTGLGGAEAVRALSAVAALLAAWEALRPRGRPRRPLDVPAATVFAILTGVAVAMAHLLCPELSARSDGAFHAGVAWAAERRLPPEDPFFAGLPLRYFCGLHAWAAGWLSLAPRLGAYVPLVWANATAVVAALLAVAALARRLGGGPRAALLAQALALAGAAPFAWVVLLARAGSGDVRGAAELRQALEHGADPALRALDPGWLHPSLVLPLDKFVVLTPFAWALAAAPLAVLALADAAGSRRPRAAMQLGAIVAAAGFLHPVGGLAIAGALLAGAAVFALRAPGARRGALRAALGVLAALAALAPYVASLAGGGSGAAAAPGWSLHAAGAFSLIVAGAWLVPPAFLALTRRGASDPLRPALLAMLTALALPVCVLRLGGDNQSKFLSLAFLLASAPAACGWSRLAGRVRVAAAALLAASAVPTLVAMGWAYAHQSAGSADAPSRPPRALVTAISQLTPRDAVLVDATQDTTRDAAPALAGETGRALLWSGGFMARKWGHDSGALRLRATAARALAVGEPPSGAAGGLLDSLGREVWLVLPDDSTRTSGPREHVVARAGNSRLVRIER